MTALATARTTAASLLLPATIAKHADEIRERGYAVIPNVLDDKQLKTARHALEGIFQDEVEIAKKRKWHNSMYKVAYVLPQKHSFFRKIGLNPRLLPIIQAVLGNHCLLSNVNGLTMTPGGENQPLHLDAPESTPGTTVYINALHCLDPFTKQNGGTRLVPRSHLERWTRAIVHENEAKLEKKAIYVEAPAGSVIAYDGALLHAGSKNLTDQPRRALHLFYHRRWAKGQWDYRLCLSEEVIAKLTHRQKQLFGFYSRPQTYNPKTHEVYFHRR